MSPQSSMAVALIWSIGQHSDSPYIVFFALDRISPVELLWLTLRHIPEGMPRVRQASFCRL